MPSRLRNTTSVLTYTERSTVVTLSVTARGVQMKQAEREATAEERRLPPIRCSTAAVPHSCRSGGALRVGILTADGKLKTT
ncbi:MAG: hypothetical protein ACLT4C_06530 [Butyricicoccus sp.]